jgi:adenosylcobalamin-dependent ribonucleoside-triphosphate reductase
MFDPSLRAQVITRRTYNRPKDSQGKTFESWGETVDRVIGHQQWLWERAQGKPLSDSQGEELRELRGLMLDRKVLTSGRTLWLGGTEVAKRREASQFNCSFTYVETVYDVVDVLWLLLQGCGVGFRPIVGTLNGFSNPLEIEVIRSQRKDKGGSEANHETWDPDSKVWTITVGDSAEAWAKSVGKLLAGKYPAKKLVLDFSELRPAGERLAGYGWISSGDTAIARAYTAIAEILNRRADSLLTRIDILDVVNWLGTILSSRRSAEICLMVYGEEEWKEFAKAKKDWWVVNPQRCQSNNSLVFHKKPLRSELEEVFAMMVEAGGSEPGFINGEAATRRAPWFKGCNPCVEILLGNKSFCKEIAA